MSKHARHSAAPHKKTRYTPKEKQVLRRKRVGIAATVFLTVLAIVFVAVGTLLCEFNYNYVSLDNISDDELGITGGNNSKDVINIALFGVDTRRSNSFKGNSDTIMVLSIDKVHKKVKLTSVMRDSLVVIEGHKWGVYKINSAYGKGPANAIKTLNSNFNLDIREYATVNFNGMAHIIEEMGGIEVDVTKAEVRDANTHIKYQAKRMGVNPDYIDEPGVQTLNGMQAVAWARIRHVKTSSGVTADFGRTDRQRYVMEKLFDKLLTLDAGKYPGLIKTMLPYVETSLSYSDLINLAAVLQETGLNFEQTRVPQQDYVISPGYSFHGASTVYYNLEYATKVMHAFIYDDIDPKTYMEQNGVDKTRWLS